MKVKTITGPSIHAALMEARRHLGDDVVLLESIPPSGDEPARITVMADARTPAAEPSKAEPPARRTAVPARRPAYGYQPQRVEAAVAAGAAESAPESEQLSVGPGRGYAFDVGGRTIRDIMEEGDGLPEPRRRGISGPAGRGQIFPNRGDAMPPSTLPVPVPATDAIEKLLTAQLTLLHDRLDKLERRFDPAIIGAAQTWMTNPLFTSLLKQGFRPATVTRLFDGLASKGYHPDAEVETLQWALAQDIRRTIDFSAPKQTNGAQVFIGPGGAGKTSLLLKLAKHTGFYGRRQTAIIVVEPENTETSYYHSPVDLFRRHGLPVQAVRTVEEMRKAVMRVQHFDHILIDTPGMPANAQEAKEVIRHVKRLVDPIMPLRVQFVFNATRSLDHFDASFLRSLSLRPETLALTHLDETQGWGRIAEWLMTLNMPVQFVSTGASVPDGVISFSPTWFVEEMMKL